MKILHINKNDSGGGAAVAALRIHRALTRAGVDSSMLVQDKQRDETNEYVAGEGLAYKAKNFWNFVYERLSILPNEREASLRYNFSIANTGRDITQLQPVKDADIIHLHWINQGFLSLDSLAKLAATGKPIVWTLHDMWPFTGGCHYAGSCLEFNEHCGYCPFMAKPSTKDLSAQTFSRKKKIYSSANITIVTCSQWLSSSAKSSGLFRQTPCFSIPNPIDTDFYKPLDRNECKRELGLPTDKKLILFGAANIQDVRKGFRYLDEALKIINDNFPSIARQIELVVFGKAKNSATNDMAFKTHNMEFVSDPSTLVKLYNAADAFILPSLQDNLPNTVVESLACGTPVVGFRIGGVPEMITHGTTGYLAEVKNSLSLANGIYTMMFFDTPEHRNAVRESAIRMFAEQTVAKQYISVYNKALGIQ